MLGTLRVRSASLLLGLVVDSAIRGCLHSFCSVVETIPLLLAATWVMVCAVSPGGSLVFGREVEWVSVLGRCR